MSPQEKPELDRVVLLTQVLRCPADKIDVDPNCPDIYLVPGARACFVDKHLILVQDQPDMTSDKAWTIAAATVAEETKRAYDKSLRRESLRHLGLTLKDAFEGRKQFKPKKREKRTIVVNRLDDKANKKRHKELAKALKAHNRGSRVNGAQPSCE